ncbi:MAG: response regulator [bacterium]|nr:response regulator [bacterium]
MRGSFLISIGILIFSLLFILPLPAFCQAGGFNYSRNYPHSEYPGRFAMNWAVLQDNRGVIYVANHAGLLEFDGASWQLLKIPNHTVRSITIADDGTLYVGGNVEMGFFKPSPKGKLEYHSLKEHLTEEWKDFDYVINILRTHEGIYFTTRKYIFLWNHKQMKAWVSEPESGDHFESTFTINGKLFVHRKNTGLMQMKNGSLQLMPGGRAFAEKRITMMESYGRKSQKMLIGTRTHGLYTYDGQTVKPFPTPANDYLERNGLYHGIGLKFSPGSFALATQKGGLVIIGQEGNIEEIFDKSWGVLVDTVKSVYEDLHGNLWLALEKGISKIEYTSPFTVYDDRSDLPGLVLSVTKHKDTIYAGTTWGLYYLSGSGKFLPVPGVSGFCHSLLSTGDGLLAAGTFGVFPVENNRVKQNLLPDTFVFTLVRSGLNPNRVWAGSNKGLVSLTRDNTGNRWTRENRFKEIIGQIRTIAEEPSGNLWLGTETRGTVKVDFQGNPAAASPVITRYRKPHGLPPGEIRIARAAGHTMFCTDKGIFRFNDKKENFSYDLTLGKTYTDDSSSVFRMVEDRNGHIWFHSKGKNHRAIPQNDGSYVIHSRPFRRVTSNQTNTIYPQEDGKSTWFADNDGLFRYDTAMQTSGPVPFNVLIRKITTGDNTIFNVPQSGHTPFNVDAGSANAANGDFPIIPYKNREIRFQVAAPFFQEESATKYRYFLEGFDNGWSRWTTETRKDYINLDSGTYRFRVKARNIYREESSEAVLQFEILPPWFKTWWAWSFYILLFGFIIYRAARRHFGKLERDKYKLQGLIEEATREIGSKKQLLEKQADELQEMAAVRTRFFANVSHEFRTPLTLIMGPLEQLLSQCSDPRQKKQLDMMRRNSQRLLALINQLLAVSRIDKGKMKLKACAQNIVPFLKGMLASFQLATAHHNIQLDFISESEDITVYFDPEKMEDVFSNLLLNVVHLASPGENITVSAVSGAEFLEISIDVSGLEMEEEQLIHIFDRFYLAEEAYENQPKGYGIGLALARELVSLHHGELEAWHRKDPTQGTVFMVRLALGNRHLAPDEIVDASLFPSDFKTPRELPVLALLEKKETGHSPVTQSPVIGKGKDEGKEEGAEPDAGDKIIILLVEDNADTRDFITEALEPTYSVECAPDGREGIKKARELIPDLVISDIMMPYVNGYEVLGTLKKDIQTSHIPIILLTAKGGEEDILMGFETGADDYITKPFNTKLLQARIKNLIDLRWQWQLKMERQMILQPTEVSVSSIDEVFIKELQEIIETSLTDPEFNVEQLAKKLYMSRATLYRKIHALTGESPHRFIRSYRLKRAAQLLKANFGNVGEVAMEVGFTNISYFSQCFKEKFHLLPSEYQNSEANN